ncbi:MAG: transcriptional regulator [Planctomycetaceae bacterium]|nr:transcriptional regulator [Planctomycetaceae bacterium]
MPTSPGSRHRRIRSDHATELAEDYVEAIAEIIDQQGVCRGTDTAERFAVSHVTVNRTIGRLERDGYVKAEPYAPVELTAKGRRLASESSARHEIVLRFLVALGVPQASAAIDSEGIEELIDQKFSQPEQRRDADGVFKA